MSYYDGSLDGKIHMYYIVGLKPRQIYRKLQGEFNGNAPLTERTVYNKVKVFDREAHQQHITGYRTEEFMAEMRKLVEAHFALFPRRKEN